jgi:hypothetical protein
MRRSQEAAEIAQRGHPNVDRWSGVGETKWEEYSSFEERWAHICHHLKVCKRRDSLPERS